MSKKYIEVPAPKGFDNKDFKYYVVTDDQINTYLALSKEYKELTDKAPLQSGDELDTSMIRLREIDKLLREADAAIPKWTGGSSNYQNALSNNLMEEMQVHALCTGLIITSWWAGWLPFGWMHSIAATYYAKKARRIYNAKVIVNELLKLQPK